MGSSTNRIFGDWVFAFVLTVAASAGAAAPTPIPQVVHVAAAADLQSALPPVIDGFQQDHPDVKIEAVYGSSGTFFAQLREKAPFALFLSADMDYPRQLLNLGRAVNGSNFVYGIGHLVLWVPKASKLDLGKLGMNALQDPSVHKIAIANPRVAPYGRAAEAALRHYGLYDGVAKRLVFGESIAQTAQFVATGAADIGLTAGSLAAAPAFKDTGRGWDVPQDAYPRLEQGGVLIKDAAELPSAQAFKAYLTGPAGRKVLAGFGFGAPGS